MPERDDDSPARAPEAPGHDTPTHDAPTHGVPSRAGELSPSAVYRLAIDAGAPPSQIGPYRLIRRVGEGGMGGRRAPTSSTSR